MKTKAKMMVFMMSMVMILGGITGCGSKENKNPIAIAALNGPTGMGMVKIMETEPYAINLYQSPDEIVGKVVNNEIDIACVPSNLAAVLYNKTQGGVKLLATNTLGVLYVVENGNTIQSMEDLRGKTILVSGKGSTPEFIFKHLLEVNGIDSEKDVIIEYYANHADIASALASTEGTIALLPQPFVTTVTMKNEKVKIALDLNEAWQEAEKQELPMGTIIATKDFVEKRPEALKRFLKDYEGSVSFVNSDVEEAAKLVAKYGIVPDENLAKIALPKCHIVYRDSKTSKDSLNQFFSIISKQEPKAIGGKLPDEAFYLEN